MPEESEPDNEVEAIAPQAEASIQSPLHSTVQEPNHPPARTPVATPVMSEPIPEENPAVQQSATIERLQIEVDTIRSLLRSSVDTIAKLTAECQRLDSCVKLLSNEVPLLRAQVQSLQASSSTSTSRQNGESSIQRSQTSSSDPQGSVLTEKFIQKSTPHR